MAMIKNAAFTGSYPKNPFLFKPNHLTFAAAYVNPFMHNVVEWPNILQKSCGVNTARLLKYALPFYNIMHERVNGKSIPANPVTLNFQSGGFLDDYRTIFATTGKINRDEGIGIVRNEHKDGFSLFGFDLSPAFCVGGNQEFNPLMPGGNKKVTHT